MDLLNKATGSDKKDHDDQKSSSGGGILDKLNAKAGGGKESEKDEDALDKGMSMQISSPR